VLRKYIGKASIVDSEKERTHDTALWNSLSQSGSASRVTGHTDTLRSVGEVRCELAQCVASLANSVLVR